MKEQTIFEGAERNLLAAMLSQAVKDSQNPDPFCAAEAQHWITDTGVWIAQYLGFLQGAVWSWLSTLPTSPTKPMLFNSKGGLENVA